MVNKETDCDVTCKSPISIWELYQTILLSAFWNRRSFYDNYAFCSLKLSWIWQGNSQDTHKSESNLCNVNQCCVSNKLWLVKRNKRSYIRDYDWLVVTAGWIDWRVITACGSSTLVARSWVVKKGSEQPLVCDLLLAFSLATLTQTKHRPANKKSRKVCFTFTPSTNNISCHWDSTFFTWTFRSVSKIRDETCRRGFAHKFDFKICLHRFFPGGLSSQIAPVAIFCFGGEGLKPLNAK